MKEDVVNVNSPGRIEMEHSSHQVGKLKDFFLGESVFYIYA
jgi:hypothetical protein